MNRVQYARYVLVRAVQSAAIAAGAGLLALALQRLGVLRCPPWHAPGVLDPWAGLAARAVWPAAWAFAAHVVLGPKQARPVYLRVPGAMYVYAGVKVDRAAGCRGGFVTGATGSGKTLACILPRLHSLCVNEAGSERAGWSRSAAGRELAALRREHARLRELARHACRGGEGTVACESRLRDAESAERRLAERADAHRPGRFRVPPWGGFVCGEKGNEWRTVESLLRHHGRPEDLCVLRTRPAGSGPGWSPPVRYNLLSRDSVPADTLAKMVVDTGLATEQSERPDDFFVPQARDKIAWGIRLLRAVRDADPSAAAAQASPSLSGLLELLTVQDGYLRHVQRCAREIPSLSGSAAFREARFQLESHYWNQPPDQLGGVRSTVYNFLVPFAEPEIAEVFCCDSTFDLRDIERGKVVCLALPQRYALQRRYVATLLKALVYQVVLERFDREGPDAGEQNVILIEQDEWQRHAVQADCDVDIVREARGAVYAAAQSQNAVWHRLGGREKAAPLIANLRNRWICQSATEECAEESSNVVSGKRSREVSYTHGPGSRTTSVSFAERPALPRRVLRTLGPFHVVFAPAEGRWLYRVCIAMPATADGRIPDWWFGDWNPLHWAARALGLGSGTPAVPPWRAAAPARAQLRRLLGLDGTFIVLSGVRSRRPRETE